MRKEIQRAHLPQPKESAKSLPGEERGEERHSGEMLDVHGGEAEPAVSSSGADGGEERHDARDNAERGRRAGWS